MLRYRLDDLGWCQFEWLIQALLKDRLGIGVESWGGHCDYGRDAWCNAALHFPAKDVQTRGPFLFQMKFIEEANAAGAKPMERLIGAVRAEMKKAVLRQNIDKSGGKCVHYVLLTNCVISAQHRQTVISTVSAALPDSTVHLLCGNDICDLLDLSPGLRRSFPQLLSIRDLDALLADLVDRQILQKSSAAVAEARDVIDVFVPTNAYAQAWEVLRKSHFVVLEGPPEMGKTAIAWMLALAQITNGWEAVSCDRPEDFFGAYRSDISQIFVADDAFGRTEYDPTRGANWESQLHRVYARLGNSHWLVWTSRKHILERARKQMDLQGPASEFPKPAEVLVDASKLTNREKALILYRHAKHSISDPRVKPFIKHNAVAIVSHTAFTPERIRRFVSEALPRLSTERMWTVSGAKELMAKVHEEINNPTERMRKSFCALSIDHKWMLLSLLEGDHYCLVDALVARFMKQQPNSTEDAQSLLDELTEAFIRIKDDTVRRYAEWIHPSYRDLVVEQLRDDGSLKSEFLRNMSLQGINLALSVSGGKGGTLHFPLMRTKNDWILLGDRCVEIAKDGDTDETAALLTILTNAIDQASAKDKPTLTVTMKTVCSIAREHWDAIGAELQVRHIVAFGQASIRLSPLQPMPSLDVSWKAARKRLERDLADDESDFLFDFSSLDDFLALRDAIEQFEPRLLRQAKFPKAEDHLWTALLDRVGYELDASRYYGDAEGYDSEADASFGLADSLKHVAKLMPSFEEEMKPAVNRLVSHANNCRETYEERKTDEGTPDESGSDEYRVPIESGLDDIAEIFTDL